MTRQHAIGFIGLGTSSKKLLGKLPRGPKLIIDTNEAVRDLEAEVSGCVAFHLTVDRRPPSPPEICTRHGKGADETGAALVSSYAAEAWWQELTAPDSQLKEKLREVVDRSDAVVVRGSEKGGSGTGGYPGLSQWLSTYAPGVPVIALHDFDLHPTLRSKQAMRFRDLFICERGPAKHLQVLTKGEEAMEKLAQIPPEDVKSISGLLTNLNAVPGQGPVLASQVKRFTASVERIVESVGRQVTRRIRHRLKEGRDLDVEEKSEALTRFEQLKEFFQRPTWSQTQPAKTLPAELDLTNPKQLCEELERRAKEDVADAITRWKKTFLTVVSKVGLNQLDEGRLEALRSELEDRQQDMERQGKEAQSELVDAATVEAGAVGDESFLPNLFGANGQPDVSSPAKEYQEAFGQYTILQEALRCIQEVRNLTLIREDPADLPYTLPEGELLEELVDWCVPRALKSSGAVQTGLGTYVEEERLSQVVQEALANEFRDELTLDFEIDRSTVREGLVKVIPPAVDLRFAGAALNVGFEETYPSQDGDTIRLYRVAALSSPDQVPELYNKLEQADEELQQQRDRKYVQRKAVDVHPIPLRQLRDRDGVFDERGEPDLDHAALIVTMAYLKPGLLRFDGSGVELEKSQGDSVHYSELASLARNLTLTDRLQIRTAFWNRWFAPSRQKAVRRLNRLIEGDLYRKDQRHNRFRRLEDFLGASRLQDTLEKLRRQAHTAEDCWR